ncbi:hypothetical protein PR202_ga28461 [Eleusine coracana subsp. coracana]|uniref:F-box domain-containing protein n=1 Tax=Eleusine coracana subsp. coracana TaxID=191504 RepID=A0AAV5DJ99_ELECO|nr:hypothetical protein PR202_ga28461 [Eleusine coracana subsp. coracana]
MVPPPLPLKLINDVTAKILLRLLLDEPEHLVRASVVCKPWLRIVCDPGFLRRYRAFHGAPAPARPSPQAPGELDVNELNGLINIDLNMVAEAQIRKPRKNTIKGWFPKDPDINWLIFSAAVLCATDDCDHLDCHGGPFRVVFVSTDADEYVDVVKASVYSSEAGRFYTPYVQPRRAALVEDEICCTIRWDNSIVKYDLGKNCLSMIKPPPHSAYYIALMEMEDGALGFAWIEDSRLHLWSRKADSNGVAEWVQRKVIELKGIIPAAGPDEKAVVVGSAEGVDVIFVSTGAGLFTIKLNSGMVKKIDEPGVYFSVLPYMSFYTPGTALVLAYLLTIVADYHRSAENSLISESLMNSALLFG